MNSDWLILPGFPPTACVLPGGSPGAWPPSKWGSEECRRTVSPVPCHVTPAQTHWLPFLRSPASHSPLYNWSPDPESAIDWKVIYNWSMKQKLNIFDWSILKKVDCDWFIPEQFSLLPVSPTSCPDSPWPEQAGTCPDTPCWSGCRRSHPGTDPASSPASATV